jgi:ketosteroid isomerase-like protein
MTTGSCSAAEATARQFFADLQRVLRGENVDPYAVMAEDVEFIVTGQTPLSGVWHGMKSIREAFLPQARSRMGHAPGHGLFPIRFIAEGNDVAVIARGRGSSITGYPYNNSYVFWFTVANGKVVRYIEDFDSSLAWQAIFRCHLEPAAGGAHQSTE